MDVSETRDPHSEGVVFDTERARHSSRASGCECHNASDCVPFRNFDRYAHIASVCLEVVLRRSFDNYRITGYEITYTAALMIAASTAFCASAHTLRRGLM